MPANPLALELLAETGPLAVSSANLTGQPAATTATEAVAMLGDAVSVYLDGGDGGTIPSTIVDATRLALPGGTLGIVRQGMITATSIRAVVGVELCPE
jgi:tRNA A37 threonylcarbamoyladenosine synthetase subunit TsaC/SUA5/YrdC